MVDKRVTADEGELGEQHLRDFQDNEKTIPTILTTSQKLSTGVDARNVRNIVLMRPINSMIEFKQIIGRGTRVLEEKGKVWFTIIDYTGATRLFYDPAFDGDPVKVTKQTVNAETGEVIEDEDLTNEDLTGSAQTTVESGGLPNLSGLAEPRKFYVDGVLVRSVENTHWHQPLYLIFDSETMPGWFGMPDDADLPSTFSVEYVRAWKKKG